MILRFTDTITKHIKGRAVDTPVPLRASLKHGLRQLFSALIFKYPDFNLTKHDCSQIDALVDNLAAEGRLIRGRVRERYEWIGVAVVEKMARAWFQAALDDGCLSWDIVIHKAMTVVLQSALCCRGGDIALSKLYTVEFMRWEHLVVKVPPGKNTLDDVQLTCQLKFVKGHK